MLEAAPGVATALGLAFSNMFEPTTMLMLMVGVFLGLVVGVIPGIGGIVGLSLLLPFTFQLEPHAALAMLIAMYAVIATSDSIPAVLFGVPGTVGSAATVLDGYPMARNGEAGRALGTAFTSSMAGGILGAAFLAASLPILRPVVLSVGSPEMMALCVFGLSLTAALSGRWVLRGLVAACLGLVLSMVGEDYQSGTMRATLDTLYLWDGIPLIPFALGLFAIPEIADLAIRRSKISGASGAKASWKQSLKDVWSGRTTLAQSSAIGAGLGALPGLGAAVIDWIAYAAAARSNAADKKFGQGDIRGVIASEAANNAKSGGALIPTIAFGVPGSAAMSILLGAFTLHGIVPGPDMLSGQLDITFTLILSIAMANILGAAICFMAAPHLARIVLIPAGVLVPTVLALVFIGAMQGLSQWGDLVVLLSAGALGFVMKALGWPRPPMLLGFVLGLLFERYLATSYQIYSWEFLARPGVVVILAFTLWGLLRGALRTRSRARRNGQTIPLTLKRPAFGSIGADEIFAGGIACFFLLLLATSSKWPANASLVWNIVSVFAIGVLAVYLINRLLVKAPTDNVDQPESVVPDFEVSVDMGDLDGAEYRRRSVGYFLWLVAYCILAVLIGPIPAASAWIAAYASFGFGLPTVRAIGLGAGFMVFAYLLLVQVLSLRLPAAIAPQFF